MDVDSHLTACPPTSFRRPAVPLSVGDKQVQTLRERTMPEAKVDLDTGRETRSLNTSGVFLKKHDRLWRRRRLSSVAKISARWLSAARGDEQACRRNEHAHNARGNDHASNLATKEAFCKEERLNDIAPGRLGGHS